MRLYVTLTPEPPAPAQCPHGHPGRHDHRRPGRADGPGPRPRGHRRAVCAGDRGSARSREVHSGGTAGHGAGRTRRPRPDGRLPPRRRRAGASRPRRPQGRARHLRRGRVHGSAAAAAGTGPGARGLRPGLRPVPGGAGRGVAPRAAGRPARRHRGELPAARRRPLGPGAVCWTRCGSWTSTRRCGCAGSSTAMSVTAGPGIARRSGWPGPTRRTPGWWSGAGTGRT